MLLRISGWRCTARQSSLEGMGLVTEGAMRFARLGDCAREGWRHCVMSETIRVFSWSCRWYHGGSGPVLTPPLTLPRRPMHGLALGDEVQCPEVHRVSFTSVLSNL